MNTTVTAIPVDADGNIGHSWGKAPVVAIATVVDGAITDWTTHDVGWDRPHDEGSHGAHHARIARFTQEHHVNRVIAHHMGADMRNMLSKLGVRVDAPAQLDARSAVVGVSPSTVDHPRGATSPRIESPNRKEPQ